MQKLESRHEQIAAIYPLIQKFCRRYPELNPEDLAQDVALKLLRYTSLPANPGPGWVRVVVRNAACDKFRELQKESTLVDSTLCLDADGDMLEGSDHKVYLAHEIHPQQEADEEMLAAIQAAIAALPEAQREVLQLHCDGKSYDAIAAITNANIGTVRSRLHYARSKAQEMLAAYR